MNLLIVGLKGKYQMAFTLLASLFIFTVIIYWLDELVPDFGVRLLQRQNELLIMVYDKVCTNDWWLGLVTGL